MPRMYFPGGGDVANRESEEINRGAFACAGEEPGVYVLNWTARQVDIARKYKRIRADCFGDLVAGVSLQCFQMCSGKSMRNEKVGLARAQKQALNLFQN